MLIYNGMKKEGKLVALISFLLALLFVNSYFVSAENFYNNYPENLITCYDSDFGANYLEKGLAKGIEKRFSLRKNIEKKDYCIDDKTLVEYYCENGFVKSENYKCLGNCENGKCVVKTPEEYEKKKKEEKGALNALINLFSFKWLFGEELVFLTQSGDCFDSSKDPILICTCNDLNRVRENLAANYELQNNIDCNVAPYNTGEGFEPIPAFLGVFYGNRYSVSNLMINKPNTDGVGLFNSIGCQSGKCGQVRNLDLKNVNIIGKDAVGGLAGSMGWGKPSIIKCSVNGMVQGHNSVGGLVGNGIGLIANSYSNAEVSGNWGIGGLIGYNYNSEITDSYATGSVSGATAVGGLIGNNFAEGDTFINQGKTKIINSYATGNVSGTSSIGGFIGENSIWDEMANSEITNCFSTGSVSGTSSVGGFIGKVENRMGRFSMGGDYYNHNNNPNVCIGGQASTPGCTIIENNQAYFYSKTNPPLSSWDFNSIWRETSSFPELIFTAPCPDCNDNDVCTTDYCSAEICRNIAATCDDNDLCTDDSCDAVLGCQNTPRVCDDSNICTDDSCDPSSGCVTSFNTATCNDNNLCTENDVCSNGACFGAAKTCDDSSLCTTDSCDSLTGNCNNVLISCDDSNLCTTDTCNPLIGCERTPKDCDDSDACTTDSCNPNDGECIHTPKTCPAGQSCENGVCVVNQCTPACDDSSLCTTDSCNIFTKTCEYTPLTCNDNDICTTDSCDAVSGCQFSQKDCNDNNECTTDNCDLINGCKHSALSCNDNNACNGIETCDILTGCKAGSALNCDDGNTCTTDSCNPSSGCMNTLISSCQSCSTNNACDDNNACNGVESCVSGSCQSGNILNCDDGNACTTDSCDKLTGCEHSAISGCGETPSPPPSSSGGCTPNCVNRATGAKKQCGPDGCGGSCGTCLSGKSCDVFSGKCVVGCIPKSCFELKKECGRWDNGCGLNIPCGDCVSGEVCENGTCIRENMKIEWVEPTTSNINFIQNNFTKLVFKFSCLKEDCETHDIKLMYDANGIKKLVSMKEGDKPLYTNVSNPFKTSALKAGKSEFIEFWVNATGNLGYNFKIYAEGSLNSGAKSGIIGLQKAKCSKCIPNCAGKTCGSDGCGGICGTCKANTKETSGIRCIEGKCVEDECRSYFGWELGYYSDISSLASYYSNRPASSNTEIIRTISNILSAGKIYNLAQEGALYDYFGGIFDYFPEAVFGEERIYCPDNGGICSEIYCEKIQIPPLPEPTCMTFNEEMFRKQNKIKEYNRDRCARLCIKIRNFCMPDNCNDDGTTRECGDDGCGNIIGNCPDGSHCDSVIGKCIEHLACDQQNTMPESKELQDVWNNPEKYKYAPVPGDPSYFRNIQCEEHKDGKMVRRADGSPCYYTMISSYSYSSPNPFFPTMYNSRDMIYPTSGELFANGICLKGICMPSSIFCDEKKGECNSQTGDKYSFIGMLESTYKNGEPECSRSLNQYHDRRICSSNYGLGGVNQYYSASMCHGGIYENGNCNCPEGTTPAKESSVSYDLSELDYRGEINYHYSINLKMIKDRKGDVSKCCKGEVKHKISEEYIDCFKTEYSCGYWLGWLQTQHVEKCGRVKKTVTWDECMPEPEVAWKPPEKTGKVFEAKCPSQITCLENRGFFCNPQTGNCEPSKCNFNNCEAFSPTPSCVFKENSDGKYELSQEDGSCISFCKERENCIDGRCYSIKCKTHEECKDNELCINNQCIGDLCLNDVNCGRGKVCSYGSYVYGFGFISYNIGAEKYGKCIGATCNYDSDCGEGDVCLSYFSSQGKRCQPNSCIVGVNNCAGNKQCQGGKWVPRVCGESATCPTNSWFGFSSPPCGGSKELCDNGRCNECNTKIPCAKGYNCIDEKCVKEEGCPFACEIENCYEPDFNGECVYICDEKNEKCVKGMNSGKGFCVAKINEKCEQWDGLRKEWVYICKPEQKCVEAVCVNKCSNCQRPVLNPDTNEVSCVNNCLDGQVCINGFAQYFPEHKTPYQYVPDFGIYGGSYGASEKYNVYQEHCGYENKIMLEEYKAEPMRGSYGDYYKIPFSNLNGKITFTRIGCKASCEGKSICADDGCGKPCRIDECMDESSCDRDRVMLSKGSCENFKCVHSEPEFLKDCLKTGMYGTCSMCKETPEHEKEVPDCPVWDFYKMCGKTKKIIVPKTAECAARETGSEPGKVAASDKEQVYPLKMPESYSELCQLAGSGASCAGGVCPYGQNYLLGYSIFENENKKNNSGIFSKISLLDSILKKPKISGDVALTREAGGCTGGSCPNPQLGGGCKCGEKCEECIEVSSCSKCTGDDCEEESCPVDNNLYPVFVYSLNPEEITALDELSQIEDRYNEEELGVSYGYLPDTQKEELANLNPITGEVVSNTYLMSDDEIFAGSEEEPNFDSEEKSLNSIESEIKEIEGFIESACGISGEEIIYSKLRLGELYSFRGDFLKEKIPNNRIWKIGKGQNYISGTSPLETIFIRTSTDDFSRETIEWSPDKKSWIPISRPLAVPYNYQTIEYRGRSLSRYILEHLSTIKFNIEDQKINPVDALNNAIKDGLKISSSFGSDVNYISHDTDYEELINSYKQAIEYLKEAKGFSIQNNDKQLYGYSTLILAKTYLNFGELKNSEEEYKNLLKEFNEESFSNEIKAKGYLGFVSIALVELENGINKNEDYLAYLLQQLDQAKSFDPNNKEIKIFESKINEEILQSVYADYIGGFKEVSEQLIKYTTASRGTSCNGLTNKKLYESCSSAAENYIRKQKGIQLLRELNKYGVDLKKFVRKNQNERIKDIGRFTDLEPEIGEWLVEKYLNKQFEKGALDKFIEENKDKIDPLNVEGIMKVPEFVEGFRLEYIYRGYKSEDSWLSETQGFRDSVINIYYTHYSLNTIICNPDIALMTSGGDVEDAKKLMQEYMCPNEKIQCLKGTFIFKNPSHECYAYDEAVNKNGVIIGEYKYRSGADHFVDSLKTELNLYNLIFTLCSLPVSVGTKTVTIVGITGKAIPFISKIGAAEEKIRISFSKFKILQKSTTLIKTAKGVDAVGNLGINLVKGGISYVAVESVLNQYFSEDKSYMIASFFIPFSQFTYRVEGKIGRILLNSAGEQMGHIKISSRAEKEIFIRELSESGGKLVDKIGIYEFKGKRYFISESDEIPRIISDINGKYGYNLYFDVPQLSFVQKIFSLWKKKTDCKPTVKPLVSQKIGNFIDEKNAIEVIFRGVDPLKLSGQVVDGKTKININGETWLLRTFYDPDIARSELTNRKMITMLRDLINSDPNTPSFLVKSTDAVGYQGCKKAALLEKVAEGSSLRATDVSSKMHDVLGEEAYQLRADLIILMNVFGMFDSNSVQASNLFIKKGGRTRGLNILSVERTGDLTEFDEDIFVLLLSSTYNLGFSKDSHFNNLKLKRVLEERAKFFEANKLAILDAYEKSLHDAGFCLDVASRKIANVDANINNLWRNIDAQWNSLKKIGRVDETRGFEIGDIVISKDGVIGEISKIEGSKIHILSNSKTKKYTYTWEIPVGYERKELRWLTEAELRKHPDLRGKGIGQRPEASLSEVTGAIRTIYYNSPFLKELRDAALDPEKRKEIVRRIRTNDLWEWGIDIQFVIPEKGVDNGYVYVSQGMPGSIYSYDIDYFRRTGQVSMDTRNDGAIIGNRMFFEDSLEKKAEAGDIDELFMNFVHEFDYFKVRNHYGWRKAIPSIKGRGDYAPGRILDNFILEGFVPTNRIAEIEKRLKAGIINEEEKLRLQKAKDLLSSNNLPLLSEEQERQLLLAHYDPVKISKVWRLKEAGLLDEQIKLLGDNWVFGKVRLPLSLSELDSVYIFIAGVLKGLKKEGVQYNVGQKTAVIDTNTFIDWYEAVGESGLEKILKNRGNYRLVTTKEVLAELVYRSRSPKILISQKAIDKIKNNVGILDPKKFISGTYEKKEMVDLLRRSFSEWVNEIQFFDEKGLRELERRGVIKITGKSPTGEIIYEVIGNAESILFGFGRCERADGRLIGYAFELARQGEEVILLTNDKAVIGVSRRLNNLLDQIRSPVIAGGKDGFNEAIGVKGRFDE